MNMTMLTEQCLGRYLKQLIGRTEIEDGLKRLDKLTQEEARMAAAQNLKVTHAVAETVVSIDNRVDDVDDRVAGVSDQVAGIDDRVAGVDDRVQQMADQAKRMSSPNVSADYETSPILSGNQMRESVHKWLSPPDPSTNHNIACGTHHKKEASWFFQGSIFQDWKSAGSLLWIHGKRLPFTLSNSTPSDGILYCSWLGQKCHLVRGVFIVLIWGD